MERRKHYPSDVSREQFERLRAQERKKMLQWWADYVDSIVNESKVIVGNFGGIASAN